MMELRPALPRCVVAGHGIEGGEGEAGGVDVGAVCSGERLDGIAIAARSLDAVGEGEDVGALEVEGVSTDERGEGLPGAELEDASPLPAVDEDTWGSSDTLALGIS